MMLPLHMVQEMKHSPVQNYVLPGLTSWLIGAPSEKGCVRLFENEIETMEFITPHSHRFNFQCLVLEGWVENCVWRNEPNADHGELYIRTIVQAREGGLGTYLVHDPDEAPRRYVREKNTYTAGEMYGMGYAAIHSIRFSKGAKVLFFEGPKITGGTMVLEPWVQGERVPTFRVDPWMFKKS